MMTKIMTVDDEELVRNLIKGLLDRNGYNCITASNTEEGRELLKKHSFEMILCDIKMPGESGVDFIRDVIRKYPDTAAVMVTGIHDLEVADTTIDMGCYGYLMKPFSRNQLLIAVQNALRRRELEIAHRNYQKGLEKEVAKQTATLSKQARALRESMAQLQKVLKGIIHVIGLTVEARDPYTAGHQRRVADLACAIALEMKIPEKQIQGIRLAGVIHDLGKISVPAEILSKPTRLTEVEFSLIKTHPQVGYEILKEIEFPWPLAQTVHQHHEKMDGSGYPQGIRGKETLLEARILAVADVVEAMASHRPYRPALGTDKALEELSQKKGVFYDPAVVEACLALFTEKGYKFEP